MTNNEYLDHLKKLACSKANDVYNFNGLTTVKITLFNTYIKSLSPKIETIDNSKTCCHFTLTLRPHHITGDITWYITTPVEVHNNPKDYVI
jgi:hypothetical protein